MTLRQRLEHFGNVFAIWCCGVVLGMVLFGGCASPTAPTPPTPAPPSPPVSLYRWDQISNEPGCVIARPVPMLTNVEPTTVFFTGPSDVTAIYNQTDNTSIFGMFRKLEKFYALCSWERRAKP